MNPYKELIVENLQNNPKEEKQMRILKEKRKIRLRRGLTAILAVTIAFGLIVTVAPPAGRSAIAAEISTINIGPRANDYEDPVGAVYVATNGNDVTATGSIDKPYKSINTALTAANPGDTVVLREGTYHEKNNVRFRKPNITLKSAKNEWAIIDFPLSDDPDAWKQTSAIRFDPESAGSKLQAVEVIGGFYAVCMETTWEWHISDPYFYGPGASNIIIEDCVLHDSRNDVVKIKPNCNNITIRFNEIYNSGREHIDSPYFIKGECNSEGIDNVNGDEMKVYNNYIHDICSTGVYAKGGAVNALMEYNRIERAYAAGIMVGFDTTPRFFKPENLSFYENFNGIVRNNLIIDTGWEGIGLYASKDAQIYNNTIVNSVTYGTGRHHSPIYFGVATQDEMNPTGCPANVNPNIHHNIVVQPSTYNNRMIDIRYAHINVCISLGPPLEFASMYISALDGMPTMDYNCYYVAGKSTTFSDNRPTAVLNMGLNVWKTHIGGDTNSIEINPQLDENYMPANPQCEGIGLENILKINAGPETPDEDKDKDKDKDDDKGGDKGNGQEPGGGSGLSGGEIAAIVLGCSGGVALIGAVSILIVRKRKKI